LLVVLSWDGSPYRELYTYTVYRTVMPQASPLLTLIERCIYLLYIYCIQNRDRPLSLLRGWRGAAQARGRDQDGGAAGGDAVGGCSQEVGLQRQGTRLYLYIYIYIYVYI